MIMMTRDEYFTECRNEPVERDYALIIRMPANNNYFIHELRLATHTLHADDGGFYGGMSRPKDIGEIITDPPFTPLSDGGGTIDFNLIGADEIGMATGYSLKSVISGTAFEGALVAIQEVFNGDGNQRYQVYTGVIVRADDVAEGSSYSFRIAGLQSLLRDPVDKYKMNVSVSPDAALGSPASLPFGYLSRQPVNAAVDLADPVSPYLIYSSEDGNQHKRLYDAEVTVADGEVTVTVLADTTGDGVDDMPIEGANVLLYKDLTNDGQPDEVDGTFGDTTTDKNGEVTFTGLDVGHYIAVATYPPPVKWSFYASGIGLQDADYTVWDGAGFEDVVPSSQTAPLGDVGFSINGKFDMPDGATFPSFTDSGLTYKAVNKRHIIDNYSGYTVSIKGHKVTMLYGEEFVYKGADIVFWALNLNRHPDNRRYSFPQTDYDTDGLMLYLNYHSFLRYSAKVGAKMGFDFNGRSVVDALKALINNTGGMWAFDRMGELYVHYIVEAPTAPAVLVLSENEYKIVQCTDVPAIKSIDAQSINFETGLSDKITTYVRPKGVAKTLSNFTAAVFAEGLAILNTIFERWGKKDFTLACSFSGGVEIGDVIEFVNGSHVLLNNNRKGVVIGKKVGTSLIGVRV